MPSGAGFVSIADGCLDHLAAAFERERHQVGEVAIREKPVVKRLLSERAEEMFQRRIGRGVVDGIRERDVRLEIGYNFAFPERLSEPQKAALEVLQVNRRMMLGYLRGRIVLKRF